MYNYDIEEIMNLIMAQSQTEHVSSKVHEHLHLLPRHYNAELADVTQLYLIEVYLIVFEPFADEDYDGAAQLVVAAVVEAADTRDLAQVLCLGASEQPLVPEAARDIGVRSEAVTKTLF